MTVSYRFDALGVGAVIETAIIDTIYR